MGRRAADTAIPDPRRAEVVVRAANDWLVEQWLSDGSRGVRDDVDCERASGRRRERDPAHRLQSAHRRRRPRVQRTGEAVRSIRIYLPIFEAAVEIGLPVVLQIGSDNATDQITPPVAGGVPATYAEYRVLSVHSHMAHLGSMIVEGVFERMPELQVLLIGGGFTWIPGSALARRSVDQAVETNAGAVAAPSPAEYFVEHVKVTSDSLERPRHGERLERALEAIPGLERTLVFASCFPHSDCAGPDQIVARLPAGWHHGVMRENARQFYRWPSGIRTAPATVGASPG